MSGAVRTAMVLAAGLGTRMRAHSNDMPKPLVKLGGRALIDHVLARLADAGIPRVVVNVHYKAELIEAHLRNHTRPEIIVSDERDLLRDTGGGVVHALPLIGDGPFLVHNSDSVWIETAGSNIQRLISRWDEARMDCLLLLAARDTCLGYDGAGDFAMDDRGRVTRRAQGQTAPYVFAGASIMHPRALDGFDAVPFSLNRVWDRAIETQRLYGVSLHGTWMHVGTPKALEDAEERLMSNRSGAT